jgi:hypothetical protein
VCVYLTLSSVYPAGQGFTPHVIIVNNGEVIAQFFLQIVIYIYFQKRSSG